MVAFSNLLLYTFLSNLISTTCPSLQILCQNSDGGISEFWISGQSLTKQTYHKSRTSHDIDMKLGPVTKIDKRHKTTSKKINDDVMSENCKVIVIFLIYGQFGAVWEPDSKRIVCKSYIFINRTFLSSNTTGAWQKCQLYGDVHFIESRSKNQKSSKVNMKSTINKI